MFTTLKPWLLTLPLIVCLAVMQWQIISLPEVERVQYIPDDGYYYLTLARHFAQSGSWTFDGINPTSGFQPLWGYLLAILAGISSLLSIEFVSLVMVFSSLITIGTLCLIMLDNVHQGNTTFTFLSLTVLVLSPWFIWNSISLTEWPLLILWSYLTFRTCFRFNAKAISIFCLALVGTFIRTDFILVPVIITIVPLLFQRNGENARKFAFALCGAAVGFALLNFHSLVISGDLYQSSLATKLYWGLHFRTGSEEQNAFALIPRLIGFDGLTVPALRRILGVIVAIGIVSIALSWRDFHSSIKFRLCGSLLVLVAYVALYWSVGSVQMWYTGSLLAPLLLVIFDSIRVIIVRFAMAAILFPILGFGLLIHHNLDNWMPSRSPYAHQSAMLQVGQYLRTADLDGHIGSWNAGIIGYYQGGSITNLDGLVNNSILPYVASGRLPAYLEQQEITHVVDFQNILTDYYRRRGGYDDSQFLARLQPVKIFSDVNHAWHHLTLWKYNAVVPDRAGSQ